MGGADSHFYVWSNLDVTIPNLFEHCKHTKG
jgi:hypothetical protein